MEYVQLTSRYCLPAFPKLLRSWKTLGALYFYRKFLEESRKPFGNLIGQHNNKISVYQKCAAMFKKAFALLGFFALVIQCAFTPKNRIIFFNHTSRQRLGENGARPFYLSSENLDFERMVIFEDKPNKLNYSLGTLRFSTEAIDETGNLISRFLNYACCLIHRINDRDIVDFAVRLYLWKILLKLLKPKRVHVLVWYGKEPLIAACKQLDIQVWDLQHGIIYEEHPIYNILDAVAIIDSSFLLPDQCLVYGEYWRQHLLRSGWDESRVKVVGYFVDSAPGFSKISDVPYILYTSQPHSNAAIIGHIRAIEAEVRRRGWKILIAIHPSENSDAYIKVMSESVEIAKFDSYDLLRNCIMHISVSSTLLWEAMIFGKPSFVLEYGREAVGLLGDLVNFGYAKTLIGNEFPIPFLLPTSPERDFFFDKVDRSLLND